MIRPNLIPAALAGCLLAAPALAADFTSTPADVKPGTYALDPAHGKITWSVIHLGFSSYTGQFAQVAATLQLDPKNPAASTLAASVTPSSIGTFNPALDKNLKGGGFLDVATFPTATFKSTSVTPSGANTAAVAGNLTLHGVTRPVTLNVTFNQAGTNPIDHVYEAGFDATASIKRSDFGIDAYLPSLGDEVKLEIEGEFHKQ